MDYFNKYKNSGKIIETIALFNTASAAALILSFGSIGYRSAYYDALILYHYAKLFPNEREPITVKRADFLKKTLAK